MKPKMKDSLDDDDKRQDALEAIDAYMDSTDHAGSPFELVSVGGIDPDNETLLAVIAVRIDAEHAEFTVELMKGVAHLITEGYKEMLEATGEETNMVYVEPESERDVH